MDMDALGIVLERCCNQHRLQEVCYNNRIKSKIYFLKRNPCTQHPKSIIIAEVSEEETFLALDSTRK
jgi:hypothetical protein